MSGVPALPSQNVLQYLLSFTAMQLQEGWAHLSFLSAMDVASTGPPAFFGPIAADRH
jgi:hypothetical protein